MLNNSFAKIEDKLRALRGIKPDKNWKTDTRAFLIGSDYRQSSFQTKVRFASIASIMVVFLLGSTSILAATSLPGEFFYPVKRTVEKIQLNLSQNGQKLSLQQNLAEKRILELTKIVHQNSQSSKQAISEVENSISAIKNQVSNEQDKIASLVESGENTEQIKTSLTQLVPEIEARQVQLEQIEKTLSVQEQTRIQTIISNLEDIKSEITTVVTEPEVKDIELQEKPQSLSPSNN